MEYTEQASLRRDDVHMQGQGQECSASLTTGRTRPVVPLVELTGRGWVGSHWILYERLVYVRVKVIVFLLSRRVGNQNHNILPLRFGRLHLKRRVCAGLPSEHPSWLLNPIELHGLCVSMCVPGGIKYFIVIGV